MTTPIQRVWARQAGATTTGLVVSVVWQFGSVYAARVSDSLPPPPNWGDGPVPADYPKPGPLPQYGSGPGPSAYGQAPSGQPYGQAPYGQAPYTGGGAATWRHPQGTLILVLGILSLVICGPLGVAAWIMGSQARREISQRPGTCVNAGQVRAGQICGMIACAFLVVVLLFVVAR